MLRKLSRAWSAFRRWPAAAQIGAPLALGFVLMLLWPRAAHGDVVYLTGDALQAEVARLCGAGCVVYNQQEAKQFYDGLGAMMSQRAQEAYEMGKADARARCASLVSQ